MGRHPSTKTTGVACITKPQEMGNFLLVHHGRVESLWCLILSSGPFGLLRRQSNHSVWHIEDIIKRLRALVAGALMYTRPPVRFGKTCRNWSHFASANPPATEIAQQDAEALISGVCCT